jgi:hypothetical protein
MAKKIIGLKVQKTKKNIDFTGLKSNATFSIVKKAGASKFVIEIPINDSNISIHKAAEKLSTFKNRIFVEMDQKGSVFSAPISLGEAYTKVTSGTLSLVVKTKPLSKIGGTLGNKVGGGLGNKVGGGLGNGGKVGPNDTLGSLLT